MNTPPTFRLDPEWRRALDLLASPEPADATTNPPTDTTLGAAVAAFLATPKPEATKLDALRGALHGRDFDEHADAFLAQAPEALALAGVPPDRVFEFAQWACENNAPKTWAKLGLALLALGAVGLGEGARSRGCELAIGRGAEPELTPFCALALQQLHGEPESQLLELAGVARGWGRAWLVEQLCTSAHPAVRAWLLRDGFDAASDSVGQAVAIARATEPARALAEPGLRRGALEGAAKMLEAMLVGDESGDIDDYEDGGPLAMAFVRALGASVGDSGALELSVLARLLRFLDEGESLARDAAEVGIQADVEFLWSQRAEAGGWSGQLRAELHVAARGLLSDERARATIERELTGMQDRQAFERALVCADQMSIPVDAAVRKRLRLDCDWLELWERACMAPSPALWVTAVAALPLAGIASGPALEYDYDEHTEVHDVLALVVGAALRTGGGTWLADEDGASSLRALWRAAMRSPLVRVRGAALDALEQLDSPAAAELGLASAELNALAQGEPERDLAADLRALASRWES